MTAVVETIERFLGDSINESHTARQPCIAGEDRFGCISCAAWLGRTSDQLNSWYK